MAKSDVKPAKYTGSRGGGGWSRTRYSYSKPTQDKTLWERFEREFKESGYTNGWLLNGDEGMSDIFLYNCVHDMRYRYDVHDWAWDRFDDPAENNGRVRKLVVQKCGVEIWHQLQKRAKALWDKAQKEREDYQRTRDEELAQQRAAFEAQQLKLEDEYQEQTSLLVRPIADTITADMATILNSKQLYGLDEGSYIDDVVDCYRYGDGFGEEVRRQHGVKLQITLSMDLSNSNYYNKAKSGRRLSDVMAEVYQQFYLALAELSVLYDGNLYFAGFTFAQDDYGGAHKQGKRARCAMFGGDKTPEQALRSVRISRDYKPSFDGTDTWFYPLFEEIERWEQEYSDPSCARLDLVLTDAVIEHKKDITDSSVIQERRDGNLQTVFLNFLDPKEWVNSTLPKRCVQYPANEENLVGLLSLLISEFVSTFA